MGGGEFLAGEGDKGWGGTARAKAWGHKTGVHPVGNSYRAFRLAFSPLTAGPEAGITASASQDRKCVSERGRHLLPVAQLVSGRAEASVLSPALCPSREAGCWGVGVGGAEQGGQRERNALRPGGLLPHRKGEGARTVMVAELEGMTSAGP